jgi:quercetin dioxygenase-like cupin family protein
MNAKLIFSEGPLAGRNQELISLFASALKRMAGTELDGQQLFYSHVHLHGGPAPVRRYLPQLVDLVWTGKIEPGKVFDLELCWRRLQRVTPQWMSGAPSRRYCVRKQTGSVVQRRSTMEIKRVGSQPSGKGPAEWFTGTVRIDPLFTAPDPAFVAGASVTFEPGARTAWHTHPLGQTLIVTAGTGWAQREGGLIEEIHPGDVVWFAPNEKHWHGATPTTAMTHIAIQEKKDGKVVEWMEQVSEQQYRP